MLKLVYIYSNYKLTLPRLESVDTTNAIARAEERSTNEVLRTDDTHAWDPVGQEEASSEESSGESSEENDVENSEESTEENIGESESESEETEGEGE